VGSRDWRVGTTTFEIPGMTTVSPEFSRVASLGRWIADDTYRCEIRYLEAPFKVTITTCFQPSEMLFDLDVTCMDPQTVLKGLTALRCDEPCKRKDASSEGSGAARSS
jgi:hypothetical protein